VSALNLKMYKILHLEVDLNILHYDCQYYCQAVSGIEVSTLVKDCITCSQNFVKFQLYHTSHLHYDYIYYTYLRLRCVIYLIL